MEYAPVISLAGMKLYTFGIYCMLGALGCGVVIVLLCRASGRKTETGLLTALSAMIFGLLCSRLIFCLMNRETGGFFPLRGWLRVTEGGWSLFGMMAGAFLGAWVSGKLTGEKAGRLLDATACGLPLMITAERLGERLFENFNVSRQLPESFAMTGWFISRDSQYGSSSLATFRICAVGAMILFLYLALIAGRKRTVPGHLWLRFLLLCGSGGILLESLRYDHFLEYSFVRFQQITAVLFVLWGMVLTLRSGKAGGVWLRRAAVISFIGMVGIGIWVEFALDRLNFSPWFLYALMIVSIAIPCAISLRILSACEKEQADACEKGRADA